MAKEKSSLDPRYSSMDNNVIFTEALVEANPDSIRKLLDQDIFISEHDKRSKALQLLGFAIKKHKIGVVRMLLEYGVCVKSPVDDLNQTALQLAVTHHDKSIVDLLLKYDADPKVTDSKFQSLLHLVFENTTLDVETSLTHVTVQEKIIEIVKLLVGLGLDVNKKNIRSETPLYYAVQRRFINVAKILVEHGARVDCANRKGESLAFALLESDVKIRQLVKTLINFRQAMSDSVSHLRWLLSIGLDIDIKTKKNKSILELTTECNAKHLMNVLLEQTKDIFFKTEKNQTILHLLFMQNSGCSRQLECDNKIALKLIDKGAPIDVPDVNGDTPFHLAARQKRLEVLCKMLDRGVNINASDRRGTPIWRIAIDALTDFRYEDRIIALIRQGVDINRKNHNGRTPVEIAARYKHTRLLRIYHELGANFKISNDCNDNLLHVISKQIDVKTPRFDKSAVDLLVSKGCAVNAYNLNGMTPLHVACRLLNNLEVIKALIDHGAKINRREKHTQRSPLHLAAWIGDVSAIKCLIGLGAELDSRDEAFSTPMHLAAREGHKNAIKVLADFGANVDAVNHDGLTPMLMAMRFNYGIQAEGLVDTLITAGANIHCRLRETNFTALHEAAMRKNANVVRCLLDGGANVSNQDNVNELAPLHIAAQTGDVQIVRMLIEKDADIHCRERTLLTPLHVAVYKENEDVIRYLVKRGANINETEISGRTPLHLAIRYQNKSAETLLELGARIDMKDSAGFTPLHEALDRENRIGFDWLIEYRANINSIGTSDDEPFLKAVVADRTTAESFLHHLVKLKAINFPVSETLETFIDMNKPQIKQMHQECLNEIALLKKPVIKVDEESSLYSLLHMHPCKRYPYYTRKEFKFVTDRKARSKHYPIYCDIIMASYRETMSHEKFILTPLARRAWYNLTEIYLPAVCVNFILAHLELDDLKRMIQGEKKTRRRKLPMNATKSAKKQRTNPV